MNIRKFKWILAFAGAVVVVLLLRGFAFTSCLIPSTGMENSIFQGERILVNNGATGCGFLSCRFSLIIAGVRVLYVGKKS